MTNEIDNLSAADRDKIMRATMQTKLGEILRCASRCYEGIGHPTKGRAFVSHATVTSDGFVMCDFIDGNDEHHMGAIVGSVADLDANVLKLAAHLSSTFAQINALTALVTSWIDPGYPTTSIIDKVKTDGMHGDDPTIRRLGTALLDAGAVNAKLEAEREALLAAARGVLHLYDAAVFDMLPSTVAHFQTLRAAVIKAGG